jgi:hypothetical protein
MSREYRFVGLCFTDFFQVKKTANMLEIGIQKQNNLDLQTQKKILKILFDQKYTGFDLRSMGRTIRELQIIFYASYYEIEKIYC